MTDPSVPKIETSASTKVLVPLDGSSLAEQAIPYASALAGTDGTLVFFHAVSDPEPERTLNGRISETSQQVEQDDRQYAQQKLEETAKAWQSILTSAPSFEIACGDPAEEILAAAERLKATSIAMASHGHGAVHRLAFGSVADRIARSSTVPVLVVRPSDAQAEIGRARIRRLIVPLDGSPLSEEALPVATAIALHLGIPVQLIQAINPAAMLMPSPIGAGPYPAELYNEVDQEMREGASTNLNGAEAGLTAKGVQVTTAIVEGPPAFSIEEAVEDGDIIVMCSHGRSGVRRWLLGSVAEKLVRQGPVPVLLVPASERR